jgi:hypothetical protein
LHIVALSAYVPAVQTVHVCDAAELTEPSAQREQPEPDATERK